MTINLPPKKILVPVDFSKQGFDAWKTASTLGRALCAELEAVYVYETPMNVDSALPPQPLTPDLDASFRAGIRKMIGKEVRVAVIEDQAVRGILSLAKARKADMIVMGTHGRKGLRRALLGSVAEGVLRRSPVPVVTVRSELERCNSILAPINFKRYSLNAIVGAAKFAELLSARLDALFVPDGPYSKALLDEAFEALVRCLPKAIQERRPLLFVRHGDPASIIAEAAGGYDMVALASHARGRFAERLLGTTAERVLRRCPTPILCIPAEPGNVVHAALEDPQTRAEQPPTLALWPGLGSA
ncbi:MAG: universal stress protein [Elusimicrobia bacterium]|nr:universal stress protein [Elusimicrobiota bacterium]